MHYTVRRTTFFDLGLGDGSARSTRPGHGVLPLPCFIEAIFSANPPSGNLRIAGLLCCRNLGSVAITQHCLQCAVADPVVPHASCEGTYSRRLVSFRVALLGFQARMPNHGAVAASRHRDRTRRVAGWTSSDHPSSAPRWRRTTSVRRFRPFAPSFPVEAGRPGGSKLDEPGGGGRGPLAMLAGR